MFQRFSEAARRAVVVAQEEARRLGHLRIDTPHLLLAIVKDPDGRPVRALVDAGVSVEGLRHDLIEMAGPGGDTLQGHLPFTTAAKAALELSLREALGAGRDDILPEHMLLGLVRQGGAAAAVLERRGATVDRLRAAVVDLPDPRLGRAMRRRFRQSSMKDPRRAVQAELSSTLRRGRILTDLSALVYENQQLEADNARLREKLREAGIDPGPSPVGSAVLDVEEESRAFESPIELDLDDPLDDPLDPLDMEEP